MSDMVDTEPDAGEGPVSRLAAELKSSRPSVGPLVATDLTSAVTLLGLPGVTRAALTDARDAAYRLLESAVRQIPVPLRAQARVYFGWTEASAKLAKGQRLKLLGKMAAIAPDTWRTEREPRLLDELARQIVLVDARTEGLARATGKRHPLDSHLNVPWLAMGQLYSRSESAALALDRTLRRALEARRGMVIKGTYEDVVASSLYWFAVANVLDENRHRDFGGDWILIDQQAEVLLMQNWYELTFRLSPFSQRQVSHLRILLRACPDWELEPFVTSLKGDPLLDLWEDWIDACACQNDDLPLAGCRVHELFEAAQIISDAIRGHWRFLIDWTVSNADTNTDWSSPPWNSS